MKKIMMCLLVVAAIGWLVARRGHSDLEPSTKMEVAGPRPFAVGHAKADVVAPETLPVPVPDWTRALVEASAAPDWEQSELLEDVVAELPIEQVPAALDQIVGQRSGAALIFAEKLIERWANQSPADAARWVQRLPDIEFGQKIFSKVAREWGEQDVSSAMDWVRSLPENENKTAAEESLATVAAAGGRADEALALLSDIPASAEREDAWSYAVRKMAMDDLDAAMMSAKQMPSPVEREQLLAGMAMDLGARNPLRAAELIATQIPDGTFRDAAVINVVRFWAAVAPDEAMAWVQAFPESTLRTAATANLLDVLQRESAVGNQAF